jgi:hypothetical protein
LVHVLSWISLIILQLSTTPLTINGKCLFSVDNLFLYVCDFIEEFIFNLWHFWPVDCIPFKVNSGEQDRRHAKPQGNKTPHRKRSRDPAPYWGLTIY